MALLGDHSGHTIAVLLKLLCHGGEMELGTVRLGPLDAGYHGLCDPFVVPQFLREGGSADPGLDAADVVRVFPGGGPVADIHVVLLLLGEGLQEPVEAASAVFDEFHDKPGVAAVTAAELPVVEEFNLIHGRNALGTEKFRIDVAEVDSIGPVVLLHHGLDDPNR